MHKILTTLSLIISLSSFAQIDEGTRTLGGAGNGYFSFERSNYELFGLNLQPNIGVFLKRNFLVQGHLNLGYGMYKTPTYRSMSLSTGLGVSARKYFTVTNRFMPFAEAGLLAQYIFERAKLGSGSWNSDHIIGPLAWGTIGMSYFLTPNLAVEAGLRYDLELLDLSNRPTAFTIPIGFKYFNGRD